MASKPYVWQMIKEAVEQSDNAIISYGEIKDYILSRYASVNPATITCQIILCSVNHPSRIHYPENKKARLCDTQYDFLFNVGRGKVARYDPAQHGQWTINEGDEGKPLVAQISNNGDNIVSLVSPKIINNSSPVQQKRKHKNPNIPTPSENEVRHYLDKWDALENYTLQENALKKLFFQTYPQNTDIDDVLIKVSALNDFYSTNIFSVFTVAKHIVNMRIDERLAQGDERLVNEIALVEMDNGNTKNFYSFATKFCSHHRPLDYPIYDSYVEKVLKYFRDVDGFSAFSNEKLKEFLSFKKILLQFRQFYNLGKYNLKDIDRYLWQFGKEKFPKSYKKREA